jgi:hypothetical protein
MGILFSCLNYEDAEDFKTVTIINKIALSKNHLNIDGHIKNRIYSFIGSDYVNTDGKIFKGKDGSIFYLRRT